MLLSRQIKLNQQFSLQSQNAFIQKHNFTVQLAPIPVQARAKLNVPLTT